MPCGLLNELPPVDEDESLSSVFCWRGDTVNKLGKDNLQGELVYNLVNREMYPRSCRCL